MQSTFQKALTNTIKKNIKKSGHKMDLYLAMRRPFNILTFCNVLKLMIFQGPIDD